MEAEREIADLKKAQFMMDKVGQSFEGLISGVTSFGLFVELKDYFVEGLIHISNIADDYYTFDELKHSLIGGNTGRTFRLGDEVSVTVTRVDLERRRIDLVLEEEAAATPSAGRRSGRKGRQARPGPGRADAKAAKGSKRKRGGG